MAKWLVASDLKSGGPVFKSRSDHYICACISFTVDPSSTPQPRLQVMRQLVCLLPVRIFNLLCLILLFVSEYLSGVPVVPVIWMGS